MSEWISVDDGALRVDGVVNKDWAIAIGVTGEDLK